MQFYYCLLQFQIKFDESNNYLILFNYIEY